MKVLYIECNMGAAGDMLTGALLELTCDPERFIVEMNSAGIPGMRMQCMSKLSCGVRGTHISVIINGREEISDDIHEHEHEHVHEHHQACEHAHASMTDVEGIIRSLRLPEKVKDNALGVYRLVAQAEARAHGCEPEQIHFHELGMMDAIADICAVCLLMDALKVDRIVVSPICTGFGEVRCMHGVVPVPAPATAYLLEGMPSYAGRIRGELLTPTGAALLKYFASEFGQRPPMTMLGVGYGMGKKEFQSANCVRAFLGEIDDERFDSVVEICCNIDDMSGEKIAYAAELMMNAGALDVYMTPIQMKKGRPGIKLSCICKGEDEHHMSEFMLTHTSTLGVRMQHMRRHILPRSEHQISTRYGDLTVKSAKAPDGIRCKLEYEDAARAARKHDVSLCEVYRAAENSMRNKDS